MFYFGVFSDYLWRAIPISDRLVYYDEVIAKRLSGMMMMNLGFSKGSTLLGCLEQGCHHRMKRLL
jgi:hypothetical protein